MGLPGAPARAQQARVAQSDISIAEAETGFCRETPGLITQATLPPPSPAIKTGDASERCAEPGGETCAKGKSFRGALKRADLAAAESGGLRKVDTRCPPRGRGFKDPAETLTEQLSRNTRLGD